MRRIPPSAIKVTVFAVLTFAMIGLLGTVIGNISFQARHDYSALFTDATAVEGGETVRLAGVPVGTVTGTEVVDNGDGRLAKVDFTVDRDLPVFRDAQLRLRYENLVGRRYLAIAERPGDGATMPAGGIFPVTQTHPALNLTVLFNGFQPLFQALDPQQVNQLSYEIIQTLQGEGGTLRELLRHTASLTSTVADKDALIGHVVDNLNTILTTVDQRDEGLTRLIDGFRDLMQGLADDRGTLDDGLPALADLLGRTDDLVSDAREPLKTDVRGLRSLAGQLADTQGVLDDKLRRLPIKLNTATRLASYGSWFNFYLCGLDARVSLAGEAVQLNTPVSIQANERDTVCGLGGPR